jgi:hypothetical protein
MAVVTRSGCAAVVKIGNDIVCKLGVENKCPGLARLIGGRRTGLAVELKEGVRERVGYQHAGLGAIHRCIREGFVMSCGVEWLPDHRQQLLSWSISICLLTDLKFHSYPFPLTM